MTRLGPGRHQRFTLRATAVAAAAAGLTLGACAHTDVPGALPGPTTATTAEAEPPPPAPEDCSEDTVTASLRPSGPAGQNVAAGTYMADIRARGRLRVGVDTSSLLFSIVDPSSGGFEGFDIDIAEQVATALFGVANVDTIEYVAIPYSERLNVLTTTDDEGVPLVDMVADTFTINCRRDAEIDFSTEYLTSSQKLLVPIDSEATRIEDLTAEQAVCAANGSTSIDNLNALDDPRPQVVGVTNQADCLVLLQQGQVDAISTDDTILAGMVAQDPNIKIVGEGFSAEPYGLGLPPDHPEWVRYVNAVLEDVRSSGRWDEFYDRWLSGPLGVDAQPPAAAYDD